MKWISLTNSKLWGESRKEYNKKKGNINEGYKNKKKKKKVKRKRKKKKGVRKKKRAGR